MNRTGVFATKEEIESLKISLQVSGMCLSGGKPMSNPIEEAHRYALKHGLSEIRGHYGCDLRTGEFLSE